MTDLAVQFKEALGSQLDSFKKSAKNAFLAIAKEAYSNIVEQSPIWSGSYILSHRISIDNAPVEGPTNVKVFPRDEQGFLVGGVFPIPASQINPALPRKYFQQAARQVKKIPDHSETIEKIEISNSIGYGHWVEAEWGHYPYQKAAMIARQRAKTVDQKISVKGRRSKTPYDEFVSDLKSGKYYNR